MGVDKGAKSDTRQRRMWQKDSAGLGIAFGNGLIFDIDNATLEILLASPAGLSLSASGLSVDLRDTNPALELDATGLGVTVGSSGGLQLTAGGLALVEQAGTVFPTTELFTGRKFYRTDLLETYTYDGVDAWLGDLYGVTLARNTAATLPVGVIDFRGPGATTVAQPHGVPNLVDQRLCGIAFRSGASITGDIRIYLGTTLVSTTAIAAEGIQVSLSVDLDASTTDGINADLNRTAGSFIDGILVLFLRRRFDT